MEVRQKELQSWYLYLLAWLCSIFQHNFFWILYRQVTSAIKFSPLVWITTATRCLGFLRFVSLFVLIFVKWPGLYISIDQYSKSAHNAHIHTQNQFKLLALKCQKQVDIFANMSCRYTLTFQITAQHYYYHAPKMYYQYDQYFTSLKLKNKDVTIDFSPTLSVCLAIW